MSAAPPATPTRRGTCGASTPRRARAIWHLPFPRGFWASPALNAEKGRLYIGNADGYFYALRMSDGGLVWKRNLDARIWGSAAVTDGCVVVGRARRARVVPERGQRRAAVGLRHAGRHRRHALRLRRADRHRRPAGQRLLHRRSARRARRSIRTGSLRNSRSPARSDHAMNGIPQPRNPAPEPGTYQDTNAGCVDHLLEPVPGPAYE